MHSDTDPLTVAQTTFKPLRIWPPILCIVVAILMRMSPGLVDEGPPQIWMVSAFGPMLCGILVLLWWLLASRATWRERLIGFVGIAAAFGLTMALVDNSLIGPGTMILTVPMGMAGFAIGAILLAKQLSIKRTVVGLLLAICGFGFSTLLRSDGMWGDFKLGLHWRWQPSPEERMLAGRTDQPMVSLQEMELPDIDETLANPEWSGFRGGDRSSRQQGMKFASDWDTTPPEQLWKIGVGPGWSSFVVAGNLLFTQEQRGPNETVVCYDAESGREVWTRPVEGRFFDPLGGPGPRATPTLANGGLFVSGATGSVMRLDPKTGDIVWQKELKDIAGRKNPPMWGYSSSPLVTDSTVIIRAGGRKGVLAFDASSGDVKWSAPSGEQSYSSPQLSTVDGEQFVLMLTNNGLDMLDPETGRIRLGYQWKHKGYRALQPQVIGGNSILLPTGMGTGTRRIRVSTADGKVTATELWTSKQLKPDFNDFVVFEGHAYGFDDKIFTCIDLETGKRRWKGGRYGKGQALLLEDSRLIFVLSETGEGILLDADPSDHTELARIPMLNGKTWNHPVVIEDRLYIRNSQEAAGFKLPLQTNADRS